MASTINTMPVSCAGGLDLRSTTQELMEKPGYAVELINFEQSLSGGYRRISGYYPVGDGTVWEVPEPEPEPEPEPSLCVPVNILFDMDIGETVPCVGSLSAQSVYADRVQEQYFEGYEFTHPEGYDPLAVSSSVYGFDGDFMRHGSFTLGGIENVARSVLGIPVRLVTSDTCGPNSTNPSGGTSGYSIANEDESEVVCYAPLNLYENVSCPTDNYWDLSAKIACGELPDPYPHSDYTIEYGINSDFKTLSTRQADPAATLEGQADLYYYLYDSEGQVYRAYTMMTSEPSLVFCRSDGYGVYLSTETGEILYKLGCDFSPPSTGGPL